MEVLVAMLALAAQLLAGLEDLEARLELHAAAGPFACFPAEMGGEAQPFGA